MNMQFIKMLTPVRFRSSSIRQDNTDGRNPFDSDLSRIVLSSHFRRLQDKAQVFPLEKCDFIRTRLTHSMEVACFARGLGLGVEKNMISKNIISSNHKGHIPSILEAAGLIHDIGNPPFGHFGEEVIKQYFINLTRNTPVGKAFSSLTDEQKKDFEYFDGNVQGFRILRKLGLSDDEFSYNLTMPVLATVIKYPYSSICGNKKGDSYRYSQKKFGFFDSEKDDYNKIVIELGLNTNIRHPLTYLLEAADDIAYSVSDIEDGHKLGTITLDRIKKSFEKNNCTGFLSGFKKLESNMDLYIQKLRIKSQSKMLVECTKTFNKKLNDIISGDFDDDLIKNSAAKNLRCAFEDLSIYNFSDSSVLKRELLGEEVVRYLLDLFYGAIFSENLFKDGEINKKTKEYKIYSLISDNYKVKACNSGEKFPTDNYKKFMLVTDYISGMTDSFALNLYKELTGQTI